MPDVTPAKPTLKPLRPQFSSGPTAKRPGWSAAALSAACLGRSHRSKAGKAKLARALGLTRIETDGVLKRYKVSPGPTLEELRAEIGSLRDARP